MSAVEPRVAVTPPAFCKSPVLKNELSTLFPGAVFNTRDRYLNEPELIEFLLDADAVLVGRDTISEEVLASLPRLKMVAKFGVGLDNIDTEALARHNVAPGWTPGVNRRSVAELTLCFILGLAHNAFVTGYQLKRGFWQKEGGIQLEGKTVGIVGCGHIGSEVVRLLGPFGCRVLVCDIVDKSAFCREQGAHPAGFDELISTADFISLHVPLTDLTRNMVDGSCLDRMKPLAFLINTSRGEVVDLRALEVRLREGKLGGAALDVFPDEPPGNKNLLALPNLMVTPHIGGNAREAVEAMGRAPIDHLARFFNIPL